MGTHLCETLAHSLPLTGAGANLLAMPASSPDMGAEIEAAVSYVSAHLPLATSSLSSFRAALQDGLRARYALHWDPSDPERGSGYRCLTRTGAHWSSLDAALAAALWAPSASEGEKQALADHMSRSMGGDKWSLWVDPGCVSMRMHDSAFSAAAAAGGVLFDVPSGTRTGALSGIKEIYGRLPGSLTSKIVARQTPVLARPNTPFVAKMAHDSPLGKSIPTAALAGQESSVQAEFADLIANASPSKRSKAVAIVRPATASATPCNGNSHSIDKSMPPPPAVVATPPRPALPPLSFTIEESTSPYVPNFSPSVVSSSSSGSSSHPVSAASTASTRTTPTLLAPSPLSAATLSSASAESEAATNSTDPFVRPSSSSSTGSSSSAESASSAALSAESCSIFSHSSSESRSSIGSIGSYMSSASPLALGGNSLMSLVAKATEGEAKKAKTWVFPSLSSSSAGIAGFPATSALAKTPATPGSPSRRRAVAQGPRHGHTLSTSSALSSGSSADKESKGKSHGRGKLPIRVIPDAKVKDYSNGNVGVLGGGVLLGSGSKEDSSSLKKPDEDKKERRSRHAKTSSSVSTASTLSAVSPGESSQRPRSRSKSRTPFQNVPTHQAAQHNPWYDHYQACPQQAFQYSGQSAPSMPHMPNSQWAMCHQSASAVHAHMY